MKNNPVKNLGLILISIFVISLTISILILFLKWERDNSEELSNRRPYADKKIKDVFINNGKLYCLNYLGELYLRENSSRAMTKITIVGAHGKAYIRENETDKLVYRFPETEVKWSDKYKSFLYYDKGTIFSFNPSKYSTKTLFKVRSENKDLSKGSIFDVVEQYVFLRFNDTSYKINLDTEEVLPLSYDIRSSIARSRDMIICRTYPDNNIMYIDLSTNKEYKLDNNIFYNNDLIMDIKSACIVEDKLYFTKSDGQIYGVWINDGEVKEIEVFPKNSDILKIKVVGIEWTGENFICVFLDYNVDNGSKNLSICEIYPDGSYEIIRGCDQIYNDTLDIPCIIKTQKQRYAYLVSTDDLVVFGWTHDRYQLNY